MKLEGLANGKYLALGVPNGSKNIKAPVLGPLARAFIVPLLALPQSTHYVLDAVLWRGKDTGPARAKALGFTKAPLPVTLEVPRP